MTRAPPDDATNHRVGLCCSCRHVRRIASAKGSVFWLCERSRTDARFRKYPPIPVTACPGYEVRTAVAEGGSHG